MIFGSSVLRHLCPEHQVNAHTGIGQFTVVCLVS